MTEQQPKYIQHAFTITGVDDIFCERMVALGIARRIYPQLIGGEPDKPMKLADLDHSSSYLIKPPEE